MSSPNSRVFSDPHLRPELKDQNPLYDRAGSASQAFKKARFKQTNSPKHETTMVEREKPFPAPRPAMEGRYETDRALHKQKLNDERERVKSLNDAARDAFKHMRQSAERMQSRSHSRSR